jgi:hypothetical protein
MKKTMLWLLVGLVPIAPSCVGSPKPIGIELRQISRFEVEWSKYLRLDSFKALAIAGDIAGLYVSGYSYGAANEEAAVSEAQSWCEGRRTDRRVDDACQTYAIGDTRL